MGTALRTLGVVGRTRHWLGVLLIEE